MLRRICRHFVKCEPEGFALLSASLMLFLVIGFGVIILSDVMASRQTAKFLETEVYATQIAEAGLYKAVFCLNALDGDNCDGVFGLDYVGETNTEFGSGEYTTVITESGDERTITATGTTANGRQKTIKMTISDQPPTTDASFDYALQVGDGGVNISNNAEVRGGPIYSHSNINCGNNAELDGPIYVSLSGGLVDNCEVYGDIHADRITDNDLNSNDIYYEVLASGNDDVGNAYGSAATPPAKTLPYIDLDYWHSVAENGGIISGDYEALDSSSLGPVKITGDLEVGNNAVVTLNGPIWVEGEIILNNNAQINLNSAFGSASTVIMTDSPVVIENNAQLNGSGHIKSFILLHSTSDDAERAIRIRNNAAGALFYAPNGGIDISNNAMVTAVAAKRVDLSNNCVINYSSDFHDASEVTLSTTPGGIWRPVPGGWRESL